MATVFYDPALWERKTTSTAAYAAKATIVCSFEAMEMRDTKKEKTIMQTETVIK